MSALLLSLILSLQTVANPQGQSAHSANGHLPWPVNTCQLIALNSAALAAYNQARGGFEESKAYWLQAIALYRLINMPIRVGNCLREYGLLHTINGDLQQARVHYQNALQHFTKNSRDYAHVRLEIGWLEYREGRYQSAIKILRDVINEAEARMDEEFLVGAYDRIGSVYMRNQQFQLSEDAFRASLKIVQKRDDLPITFKALIFNNLSWLYFQKNMYLQCTLYADRALSLFPANTYPESQASLLDIQAKAYLALGKLQKAESTFRSSLEILVKLRADSWSGDLSTNFFDRSFSGISGYLDAVWRLTQAKPTAHHKEKAFVFYESILSQTMRSQGQSKVVETVKASLPALQIHQIANYFSHHTNEALVCYFAGESHLYWWYWDQGGCRFGRQPYGNDLSHEIHALQQALQNQTQADQQQADLLLAKLARKIIQPTPLATAPPSNLIVIADGPLHLLPFALLPLQSSTNAPTLLIERCAIRYAPSFSLAITPHITSQLAQVKTALILSDPVFQRSDPRLHHDGLKPVTQDFLVRLNASSQEHSAVQALLEAKGFETLALQGFSANLTQLQALSLADYQILHLATHALAIPEAPQKSGLVLSLVNEEARDVQGYWSLSEIAKTTLNAHLVTLSACQTGTGKASRGSGSISLAQAFLQAGAQSVLASLWDIDDAATREFMQAFYGFLLEPNTKAMQALQKTKLLFRRQPQWQHPKYWAAFTLYGSDCNIF